jgi:hypothetical protein
MKYLNLTPHAITIRDPEGRDMVIQPSGMVARVLMDEIAVGWTEGGVPLVQREAAGVSEVPEALWLMSHDTAAIVSSMVLDALPNNTSNVFAPDSGSTAIRNAEGHVVAVTRLISK